MATAHEPHPMWTDGDVIKAMHSMHWALNEWHYIGAKETADLDRMAEVESRYILALGEVFAAMDEFRQRRRKKR